MTSETIPGNTANACLSAFAHKRDIASGSDLAIGQSVSFIMEDGPKGASAKKIEEEGGEPVLEDENDRLYGKIKVLRSIVYT